MIQKKKENVKRLGFPALATLALSGGASWARPAAALLERVAP